VTAPAASTARASLGLAAALALGAAISLGLARFSYALLLPPMRADLAWSYFTAGAMNTVNAAGYLVGALCAPRWLAHRDTRQVLIAGSAAAAVLLALHGLVVSDTALFALRLLTGTASAAAFISGGLLAARLGQSSANAGLVLGVYYGGTGVGIVLSALLVPPLVVGTRPHAWQAAWLALGAAALAATLVIAVASRQLAAPQANTRGHEALRWRPLAFALGAYLLFGLGYIGYMTFVVTLLREQGFGAAQIVAFYVLLGVATIASSWLWAGVLGHFRGGQALCLFNALLAVATLLPVWSAHPAAVFVSGGLFGGVFLSAVASTTALVRHNLPEAKWPAGISAFTIVFAAGQIVGPSLVGRVADGPGGLTAGFACSAGVLALGAMLAWCQKPLR
jgi:predicted MFS family arabinose efflux permease